MVSKKAAPSTPEGKICTKWDGSKFVLAARSKQVKKRVEYIAPRANRCMIQNRSSSVELCHVFARCHALKENMMKAIEYHLGVELDSLNLDSRWNCLFAASDLHVAFDKGFWGLIPKMEILQDYFRATQEDKSKYGVKLHCAMKKHDLNLERGAEQEFHTYTFLAFNPAYDGLISQFNVEGVSPKDSAQAYPFNNPVIEVKSHVHPKFVILSLGKMLLDKRISQDLQQQTHVKEYEDHLSLIELLYKRWSSEVEDAQIVEAVRNHRTPSPPPAKSRAARHDAQSYRAPSSVRPEINEGKVVVRRLSKRFAQPAPDAVQSEDRGRGVVIPASDRHRDPRSPSIPGRIKKVEIQEDAKQYLSRIDAASGIGNRDENQQQDDTVTSTSESESESESESDTETGDGDQNNYSGGSDAADSDEDQSQVYTHIKTQGTEVKEGNQRNGLKRQASSEPEFAIKPLSNMSSYLNGGAPSSPSPEGPDLPPYPETPAPKRFRNKRFRKDVL